LLRPSLYARVSEKTSYRMLANRIAWSPRVSYRQPTDCLLGPHNTAPKAIASAIPTTTEERDAITNSPIFATVVLPERRRSRRRRRRPPFLCLRSTTARRSSKRSRFLGPTVVTPFSRTVPLTTGRYLTTRPPSSLPAPEDRYIVARWRSTISSQRQKRAELRVC
jgi:hypothetical protein